MTIITAYDSAIKDGLNKWIIKNKEIILKNKKSTMINLFNQTKKLFWTEDYMEFFKKAYILFYLYRYNPSKKPTAFLLETKDYSKYFFSRTMDGFGEDLNDVFLESLEYIESGGETTKELF